MSILDGIKDKAKALLGASEPFVTKQTKSYDASKNKVIVAGVVLDGLVTVNISGDILTKQETGIDYSYTAIIRNVEQRTLSVTVLPTAQCLPVLRSLGLKQQQTKGWFNIAVHENDKIINVYRGWILDMPEITMQQEGSDRTITFGIKTMHSGTALIDQSTEFEQVNYSKYGIRPDLAGANTNSTINEDTGLVTTPIGDAVPERLEDFSEEPPINNGIDDGL